MVINSLNEFFCLHRKNLLFNFVVRNLKVKYRGSILGFFWTLLIPFAQILVFYFVYKVVMRVPVHDYLLFIVSGILPWVFFSATLNESFESLVGGQGLLTQVPVPIQAFPASAVVSNFINFMLSIPALMAVLAFSGADVSWRALLFLPLSVLLFFFTYSLAFILASLFVIFRDLRHIFGIVLQLWMYCTPILYPVDMIPEKLRWTLYVNPLSGYFVAIRDVLVYNRLPDLNFLWIFAVWIIVLIMIAEYIRVKVGPKLVERL